MTTITLPRATVEQALEALEYFRDTAICAADTDTANETIPILRAALAQQAEPVEPVAKVELMMTGGNAGLATRIVEIDDHLRDRLRPGQLLYTAPPQRKPLTDEEIEDIYLAWDVTPGRRIVGLVRAVERALEEKNRGR